MKSRKDVIPLLTFAFGTLNNKQYRRVKYWYADIIDIQNFYCVAISSRVNNDLFQAEYNIEIFAREYSYKYPEFLSQEPISADRQTLVIVQNKYPQAIGQFEILDGVHRAVNMVLSGATQAHAYIARYEE
ncbi:hypothetical protein OAK91_05300 [Planctomycetaceae bacterium]|nr:hypothetical protein [Planctomycetaceae bacterium]MDC0274128.1 hypothetical protein [Planctomycetaceae bacterium]